MDSARYTLGCGDRFGRQDEAQLAAFITADKLGIKICPVWNKSRRAHLTVHTEPAAVRAEAGRIYRHIEAGKAGAFEIEVSMDETDDPQTPVEMLFILAMVAREGIPVDTIAPKFSGCFKGIDYVGDVALFEKEFEQDVAALRFAVEKFGLKESLRLSVHSGSDKFSIYPAIVTNHGVIDEKVYGRKFCSPDGDCTTALS